MVALLDLAPASFRCARFLVSSDRAEQGRDALASGHARQLRQLVLTDTLDYLTNPPSTRLAT